MTLSIRRFQPRVFRRLRPKALMVMGLHLQLYLNPLLIPDCIYGNRYLTSLSGTVNIEKLVGNSSLSWVQKERDFPIQPLKSEPGLQSNVEAEVPKGCDKDVLFRDRVGGDQQLVSGLVGGRLELRSPYSSPVDSRSSPTGDLAPSEVVDGRFLNPITTTSSIAHLSPDGKETHEDIAFSPLNVEDLQGYGVSASGASISFMDILKRGIHLKDVDEPGTCGVHQLPITYTDCLEVVGCSSCYGRNVGSPSSGFAGSTLEGVPEMEQLDSPILNRQPRLGDPYQVVTDDYEDEDPSFCPSLRRLKRNLEEIRKQFNAYRACPNGDIAFLESRPASTLISEEPTNNSGGVTKTPSPLPTEVYPLPLKVEDLHIFSKCPKGVRRNACSLL
ncbi:hypothetical protein Nepgr_026286 [Nepenthes gracilis]|uniref:Uncharacterized protein n=1 Tax=Nepenthes gracilis TaxID=150966 RepID=A0AAD3T7U4_NEPGR|nr:hypothetical protein Nepgr_026286 [Nepenthes gracilis]